MGPSLLAMVTGICKLELSRGELDAPQRSSRECTHVFLPPTSGSEGKCANIAPLPNLPRSIVVKVEVEEVVVVARPPSVVLEVDRKVHPALPVGLQSLKQISPMVSLPSSMMRPTLSD